MYMRNERSIVESGNMFQERTKTENVQRIGQPTVLPQNQSD